MFSGNEEQLKVKPIPVRYRSTAKCLARCGYSHDALHTPFSPVYIVKTLNCTKKINRLTLFIMFRSRIIIIICLELFTT